MITGLPQINQQKSSFMNFSQKADYGLFLLTELAKHRSDEAVSLRTIAEEHQMSFLFLQKVAMDLRKAGIISADRGKDGGYRLDKSPETLTLKEILEIFEGPLAVMHCLVPHTTENCSRQSRCSMRHGLNRINDAIIQILGNTTLLSLLPSTWKPTV